MIDANKENNGMCNKENDSRPLDKENDHCVKPNARNETEVEANVNSLDTIVEKVSSFFYENDEFFGDIESFTKQNSTAIDLEEIEKTGLMKVLYSELHEQYKTLLENKLEAFICENGCTVNGFYEQICIKVKVDPECNEAHFGNMILAASDFDVFMMMMEEAARDWQVVEKSNITDTTEDKKS
eukprot:CAMPEP_0194414564 /NCGR_PEP_ID=MMETSP0176-20130528/13255_1 /TAXON_ID=216777 /ORGANISM="Proboscia alata, Strain PI-D3" /LENGTH=182 /DNA_ID=CAMNT_0039218659 /DNA_START=90 /DNA_END=638 /DNA_ORIENTATION=-